MSEVGWRLARVSLLPVWLTIVVVIAFSISVGLNGQTTRDTLSLRVAAVDAPEVGKPSGVWLVITNDSERTRFLCQKELGYSAGNGVPGATSGGLQGGVHSCLDQRDGFLLLPKESRLDRVEMELHSVNPQLTLSVDVFLVDRSMDALPTAIDKPLSWRGTLAEATTLGGMVRNGKLQ